MSEEFSISKEEKEAILKLRSEKNVGKSIEGSSGEHNERTGKEPKHPSDNGNDRKRTTDKSGQALELKREGLEGVKTTEPETTKSSPYTCEDCGTDIDKNQEKCSFCGCKLNWDGIE